MELELIGRSIEIQLYHNVYARCHSFFTKNIQWMSLIWVILCFCLSKIITELKNTIFCKEVHVTLQSKMVLGPVEQLIFLIWSIFDYNIVHSERKLIKNVRVTFPKWDFCILKICLICFKSQQTSITLRSSKSSVQGHD